MSWGLTEEEQDRLITAAERVLDNIAASPRAFRLRQVLDDIYEKGACASSPPPAPLNQQEQQR